jgi:hypothetical protein
MLAYTVVDEPIVLESDRRSEHGDDNLDDTHALRTADGEQLGHGALNLDILPAPFNRPTSLNMVTMTAAIMASITIRVLPRDRGPPRLAMNQIYTISARRRSHITGMWKAVSEVQTVAILSRRSAKSSARSILMVCCTTWWNGARLWSLCTRLSMQRS